MILATRRLGFDSGHRVTRHESKCQHPHGHRYEVEISVAGHLDHAGRVVDFGLVKEVVGGWIDAELDHGYLAAPWDQVGAHIKSEGFKVYTMTAEPTAENIAALVASKAQELLDQVKAGLRVKAVRVFETPNCWADWIDSATP